MVEGMKARFDDHVVTRRPVQTDGGPAPAGTHGFVLKVLLDPEERYVVELWLPNPPDSDSDELAVLVTDDFDEA
jgi:hypothetical protein